MQNFEIIELIKSFYILKSNYICYLMENGLYLISIDILFSVLKAVGRCS